MSSPYPSYRDSGVEWLGEVPSHWTPTRLRFLAQLNPSKSEISDLNPDTEVSFLPMEAVGEGGELSLDQTRPLNEVLTGYTYFREGDVSIAKITPCFENGKGAIMRGLLGEVGFGSTEFIVARARPDATTPEFMDWLFRSPAFRARGEAAMYGAGGQKRVPDNFVRDFVSPGAPLSEQVGIATFLDREAAKIDALIEKQRQLIMLLKEKRQAVISQAVTKGLHPHVPMKDSGIGWLGKVPKHWAVTPLGYRYEVQLGRMLNAERSSGDDLRPYLRVADVQWDAINTDDLPKMDFPADARKRYRLFPGDLLVNEGGSYVGRSAIWKGSVAECYYQKSLHRVRSRSGRYDTAEFLLFVMEWATNCGMFVAGGNQTTIDHLTADQLRSYRFAFPPIAEQEAIASHIQGSIAAIETLRKQAKQVIELLAERRAALISAAVTGKIDLRGLAKVLPFPIDRVRARGLIAAEIIERSAHQVTFGRVKLQKIAFLTETHVGVRELAGSYTREAAGPLDRVMIEEMESGARIIAGVIVDQAGGSGTTVCYRPGHQRGAHRIELADWLGEDRTAKLDELIADFAALTTKGAEAVATLYGVWNDALIEGTSPSDDEIISEFLNNWHPEKREKFRGSELPEWLDWMRRHDIVPTGSGPKTTTGRLFV